MAASWRTQLVAGNDTGDVPDIFEGAHNGIGEYVRNGILAPIDLGANAANFQEEAVNGVTWEGSTYGVPWAVENVAMLTNTDLSPECPATLDEAVANAKTLLDAGTTTLGIALQIGETGDGYHWYPLYSADGGYAFARNEDGSYDIDDMGVGKEGSIAAGERLQQLVNDGIVQASVSYDIATGDVRRRRCPVLHHRPLADPRADRGARRQADGLPGAELGGQRVRVAAVPRRARRSCSRRRRRTPCSPRRSSTTP